jgi:histone deacetylase complex regulatory component SIN3
MKKSIRLEAEKEKLEAERMAECNDERLNNQLASMDGEQDAVEYIKNVQSRISPEQFVSFLQILTHVKDVDMRVIAEKVTEILHPYPDLVLGFNTFLPEGYFIYPQENNSSYVIIDPTTQFKPSADEDMFGMKPTIEEAHAFLATVKSRVSYQSQIYKRFKDLIHKHRQSPKYSTAKLAKQTAVLFKNYPDLLIGFNRFLSKENQIPVDYAMLLNQNIPPHHNTDMEQKNNKINSNIGPDGGIIISSPSSTLSPNFSSNSGHGIAANALLNLVEARRFFVDDSSKTNMGLDGENGCEIINQSCE